MPRPPDRPIIKPGDIMISPTGGGAGWLVERVVDPRRASWSTFAVGFARTEEDAIALARKARAEASIWLQSNGAVRRARRVREQVS